jgi:hypothetical protein
MSPPHHLASLSIRDGGWGRNRAQRVAGTQQDTAAATVNGDRRPRLGADGLGRAAGEQGMTEARRARRVLWRAAREQGHGARAVVDADARLRRPTSPAQPSLSTLDLVNTTYSRKSRKK